MRVWFVIVDKMGNLVFVLEVWGFGGVGWLNGLGKRIMQV